MKRLITICAAAMMVFATSVAYAVLPSDNFDDGTMDTAWTLYEDDQTGSCQRMSLSIKDLL